MKRHAMLVAFVLVLAGCAWADTVWSQKPTVLVGIGDSITAGFGASTGHDYFSLLRGALAGHYPVFRTEQKAVSSTTSDEHLRTIDELARHPLQEQGIVVMTTGGNDLIHNYGRSRPREQAMYGASFEEAVPWVRNFAQRIDTMRRHLGDRFPGGVQVFVATIYDPTDGHGDLENAGLPAWRDGIRIEAGYNDAIASLCQRVPNTHLVDMHSVFMGHGIHGSILPAPLRLGDPNYWYYANLEDPNDRGYLATFNAFLAQISRYH